MPLSGPEGAIDWEALVDRELREQEEEGSHVELDPYVFHPSQIAGCKRQAVISKLGLEEHGLKDRWNFFIGHERHDWLQQQVADGIPGLEFEKPIELWDEEIRFVGHADVVDTYDEVIYDFKTKKSWRYYDADDPSDRHLNQLTIYMAATGIERAQLVHVLKSGPSQRNEHHGIIRQQPVDGWFHFDQDRYDSLVGKAREIAYILDDEDLGAIETKDDVPFEKCGCFVCNMEDD